METICVLRASSVFYWLLGGILGSTFAISVFVAITNDPDFWFPAGVMALILATAILILRTTSLALTQDGIRYRSLLVNVGLSWADLIDAKFATGFNAGYAPYFRIVLTVSDGGHPEEIVLNTTLFDPRKTKQWLDEVKSRMSAQRSVLGLS